MICKKQFCTGCHACCSICPTAAITMKYDQEGFLHPIIDMQKCIECGACERTCPINRKKCLKNKPIAYACISRNELHRMESSSGGIFTVIAESVIEKGGIVFGAAFNDDLEVEHMGVDSVELLHKLRGSKYLQSTIGHSYQEAKSELESGRLVLFTGTPCQISGLKSFLGKEYDNLVTQDIICHGVPSLKVWKKYLDYQRKKYESSICVDKRPSFRDKSNGWQRFSMLIHFNNGKKYIKSLDTDAYIRLFLQNLTLRPSCYNCHFKSLSRESDITLADFWGVETICKDMFDDKGVSLVFVNSKLGERLFDEIKSDLMYKTVDLETVVKHNTAAYQSVPMPLLRDDFFDEIDNTEFVKIIKKYVKIPYRKVVISKVRCLIKKYIKY